MKHHYKQRIKTAKMLVMQNLIFSGHHNQKGAEIAGFEMLSKTLPMRYIGIAEDEIKRELRTVPRRWRVWVGLIEDTDKNVDVRPFIYTTAELTTSEFDAWLTTTIQLEVGKEGFSYNGYCWAATPCMTLDLEGSEDSLIKQFKVRGAFSL